VPKVLADEIFHLETYKQVALAVLPSGVCAISENERRPENRNATALGYFRTGQSGWGI